jgi:hypothetical protein
MIAIYGRRYRAFPDRLCIWQNFFASGREARSLALHALVAKGARWPYKTNITLAVHTPRTLQKRAYNMTENVKQLNSYRKDLPKSIRHGIASAAELKTHRNCSAKLKDRTFCSGGRVAGSMFCYFHDPELEQERADNRQKGRDNLKSVISRQAGAPDIKSVDDVRRFCIETAHQIRTGELGAREGAVVTQLINQIMKTLPEEEQNQITKAEQLREILLEDD